MRGSRKRTIADRRLDYAIMRVMYEWHCPCDSCAYVRRSLAASMRPPGAREIREVLESIGWAP